VRAGQRTAGDDPPGRQHPEGGCPTPVGAERGFVNTKVFCGWAFTPGCPPCGVPLNKRMLVTASTDPVPG
jgi:hypothetical protein